MRYLVPLTFLLLLSVLALAADDPKAKAKKEEKAAAKLPPCAACTSLVESFERGLARTARGKFEGGDTAWEEKNQGVGYANSEVRLVEIQEEICKDVDRGEQQCHHNHQEWEETLEDWWKMEDRPGLRQFLCVDELKVCCPEDHYGKDCKKCDVKDGEGRICSGNGGCKGAGTRKGSGKCSCNSGYSGELCDRCDGGYYQSYKDSDKLLCSPCHKSCSQLCSGAGPKGCVQCKAGYLMDAEKGCSDIDECLLGEATCGRNKFCINTEGSHRCVKCDKACNGCDGDGPDSCRSCAAGYTLGKDGKICITEQAAGEEEEEEGGEEDNKSEEAADEVKPTKEEL